ncbi:nuclear transport factor 2 family protein [Shewanella putrefaciens]|uniref:nuclear transport factor 2 family protein n=1 Tax=Shewanella putrefaciens TaxID=24 RepID=UPI0018E80826|nr:nuclear transport factor 2 family protein [Shewanella putrefaciens]
MRILCLIWCFIFVLALNPAAVQANSGEMPQEQQLAIKYMNALTEHDYKTLRKFYNRDSVFFDKTANRKYTGGRFIIDFLERAHEGVLEYNFNVEHMYNAGSLVVMIGNYHFKGPGEQFGKPGKIIDVAIPGVTSLKLDMLNHRVTEHVDLIDYQTMSDQLAMQ